MRTDPTPGKPRTWWQLCGWAAAIVLLVTGLAVIAFFVCVAVAMNNFGSNK